MLFNINTLTCCPQVEFLRNHVLGLLEVEPLTFTCHATSDGTRVERVDASPHPPSSASGPTLNPVPLSMSGLGFDDTTPASMLPMGGPVGGSGSSASGSSGLVMADSLKKLAQMYAKQLHPGYKQIHQLISDHVSKAIEVRSWQGALFYCIFILSADGTCYHFVDSQCELSVLNFNHQLLFSFIYKRSPCIH